MSLTYRSLIIAAVHGGTLLKPQHIASGGGTVRKYRPIMLSCSMSCHVMWLPLGLDTVVRSVKNSGPVLATWDAASGKKKLPLREEEAFLSKITWARCFQLLNTRANFLHTSENIWRIQPPNIWWVRNLSLPRPSQCPQITRIAHCAQPW